MWAGWMDDGVFWAQPIDWVMECLDYFEAEMAARAARSE
jgi:hypothetical protein